MHMGHVTIVKQKFAVIQFEIMFYNVFMAYCECFCFLKHAFSYLRVILKNPEVKSGPKSPVQSNFFRDFLQP